MPLLAANAKRIIPHAPRMLPFVHRLVPYAPKLLVDDKWNALEPHLDELLDVMPQVQYAPAPVCAFVALSANAKL